MSNPLSNGVSSGGGGSVRGGVFPKGKSDRNSAVDGESCGKCNMVQSFVTWQEI